MKISHTNFKKPITAYTAWNKSYLVLNMQPMHPCSVDFCLKENLFVVVGGCLVCVFCALYLVWFTHKCPVHPQG